MHGALAFLLALPAVRSALLGADVEALIQHQAVVSSQPPKARAPPRPAVWAHFPKCGSAFVNSLIRLEGACDLPKGFVVDERMGQYFLGAFRRTAAERCPGLAHTTFGHHALASRVDMEASAGHFMGMFREPVSRLRSAYLDMVSDRSDSLGGPLNPCRSWGGWPNESIPTFPDFARASGGCAVKMLARSELGCPCGWSGGAATRADLALAKARLRRLFAFVGLTEEWRLSICLLDRMFGTGCHHAQFKQVRRHAMPKPEGDAEDPVDGELYDEARRIFRESLLRYNVTEESCRPCYLQALLRV